MKIFFRSVISSFYFRCIILFNKFDNCACRKRGERCFSAMIWSKRIIIQRFIRLYMIDLKKIISLINLNAFLFSLISTYYYYHELSQSLISWKTISKFSKLLGKLQKKNQISSRKNLVLRKKFHKEKIFIFIFEFSNFFSNDYCKKKNISSNLCRIDQDEIRKRIAWCDFINEKKIFFLHVFIGTISRILSPHLIKTKRKNRWKSSFEISKSNNCSLIR